MSGRFEGRVAVVTGAAREIGQAYAERLANEGATVAILDIADGSETVARCDSAGTRGAAYAVDLTDLDQVNSTAEAVAEAHGAVDILVNNAGIYPNQNFESMSLDDWRRIFSINVESMFLTTRAFVPQLKQSGHGRIVNMTSNAIGLVIPGQTHYVATKMAVIGLTRGLATELAEYGVTANAIGPSLTRTPGTAAGPAEFFDIVPQLQAIKRAQEPDDLTGTMAFLCSDDAVFITGQTFYVDGGLLRSS